MNKIGNKEHVIHNSKHNKMICTDAEYKEEAIIFFYKNCKYLDEGVPFNVMSEAYEFVNQRPDFKYRDIIDAEMLLKCLIELKYIKFEKVENDNKFHSLTKKGFELLKKRIK